MDIHRCRFVSYSPHSINALAFSHPPAPDTTGRGPPNLRLAVGRANGNIELWNPLQGDWVQECVLQGGQDRTIEGLVWIQDEDVESDDSSVGKQPGRFRLFSIGYSALVTEWDLETAAPIRHANSNFGEIWCLSAQPRTKLQTLDGKLASERGSASKGQCLAAGCSDGTIVLFSTEDGDLQFLRTIGRPPTKRPRILSITWKDQNTVIAGYADSTIRVFDTRNKATLRNMTLGKEPGGKNDIIIWCVRCLPDGTIVSGDSSGELKIWDSKNYSLSQRIRAHDADILDFAINGEGNTIVTGGADRRTTFLHLMGNKNKKGRRRWAQVKHRRFHQHDVKALAVFESKELSVCVSGGLDTVPIITPLREWQNEYHRSLSYLPQSPQISSAPAARLFATWWDRVIYVWQMRPSKAMIEANYFRESSELVAQIQIADEANISSAQLSANGQLLAVSSSESVKLFHLQSRTKGLSRNHFRVRKLSVPGSIGRDGAKVVTFSPDNKWLCIVGCDNDISLLRIISDMPNKRSHLQAPAITLSRVERTQGSYRAKFGSFGNYERAVSRVAFSSDSEALAIGDISGNIDTWILEDRPDDDKQSTLVNGAHRGESRSSSSADDSDDNDDTDDEASRPIFGQRWTRFGAKKLPSAHVPLLLLSFRPSRPYPINQNTDGNTNSTPNKSNLPSGSLPTRMENLVAITARHQVLEFDIMSGTLSDWSRRNPQSCLPYEFRQIKDRVTGGFWDLTTHADRLWLYGPNWLFMLDLLQDFGVPKPLGQIETATLDIPIASLGKRKRAGASAEKLIRNTGAGDSVRDYERHSRLQQTMKTDTTAGDKPGSLDLLHRNIPTLDDANDDGVNGEIALARLRRQSDQEIVSRDIIQTQETEQANGLQYDSTEGMDITNSGEDHPSSWHTYTYRSIFGIAPVSEPIARQRFSEDEAIGGVLESEANLEVVLVERPEWDLELPPRYDDGRD
ncbi:MAG: hypothetical protein Q9160_007847 [Pyrenula sp. 1 TL-2023]